MYGKNELRKQELNDGLTLEVVETFSTIQGEGPLAGTPSYFIRLAGCNLNCSFCDTDFESNAEVIKANGLVNRVLESGLQHVVITGGEPFRQQICVLIRRLTHHGIHVTIETAGTLWISGFDIMMAQIQDSFSSVLIVCSPKAGKVDSRLWSYIGAWKYIIRARQVDKEDGLPSVMPCTGKKGKVQRPTNAAPVFVQPCDEGEEDPRFNTRNNEQTIKSALKYGYRVSFQMHKALNLR